MRALFPLGRVLATPGVLAAFDEAGGAADVASCLHSHQRGEWGEVCPDDAQANVDALRIGARILSAYRTTRGVKVWIITEADRSATTVLLPEEY